MYAIEPNDVMRVISVKWTKAADRLTALGSMTDLGPNTSMM